MNKAARHWSLNPAATIPALVIIKMAIFRQLVFQEIALLPLLADAGTIAVAVGLIELLFRGRVRSAVYWGYNTAVSLILFAATLYYEHFGSIVTYTSLLEIKQLAQIQSSVKATIRPVDYVYFIDLIAAPLLVWRLRTSGERRPHRRLPPAASAGLLVAGCAVSFILIRQTEPTVNELKKAEELGFWNYQASVVSDTLAGKNRKTTLEQVASEVRDLESQYPYRQGVAAQAAGSAKGSRYFGSQKGKNVIVVQLEAFQNFPVGLAVNGQTITPVLNALTNDGGTFYFPRIFQQIGQGNTSDAEFMSNTSIYPTGTIPMSTGFGDRSLPSFAKLVQALGYEADTFHVNVVTFWDRNKLYPAIGFNHYYDKPYYVDDHFNDFGASDEELYREGLKIITGLQQSGKKFYAQFITVSSHFPFKIPQDKQSLALPDPINGKQLGDYLQAVHYTDYALGQFIAGLKQAGLWEQSIFVAYGDHFGLQPQDNDPKAVGEALGITYHPQLTRFNIPLFIHVPGRTEAQTIDQVGGQLDIMPTVANLLGIDLDKQQYVHFGHDLLNMKQNVVGSRYYLPSGSFFNNDILFMPGKNFDDGTAFSIRTLQPVANFAGYRGDYDYILKLMSLSDQYVKLLPKR